MEPDIPIRQKLPTEEQTVFGNISSIKYILERYSVGRWTDFTHSNFADKMKNYFMKIVLQMPILSTQKFESDDQNKTEQRKFKWFYSGWRIGARQIKWWLWRRICLHSTNLLRTGQVDFYTPIRSKDCWRGKILGPYYWEELFLNCVLWIQAELNWFRKFIWIHVRQAIAWRQCIWKIRRRLTNNWSLFTV